MPKVVIIQQVYKSRDYVERVYNAMLAQTFKDIKIVSQIVDDTGGSKEFIKTNYPEVEILVPGYNIGFAKGHNEIFERESPDFFQLVNPDLIMSPNYIEEMLKMFDDPKVGAVTGKLLRYDFIADKATNKIDTTGVVITKAGNAKDRGQNQEDYGQYNKQTQVLAVSGAGPMYRRTALEAVKYKGQYFDEDFHSYYEDVDLGWRMSNAGWKCMFQPTAVAFHGRAVSSSPGGYKKFFSFLKHRKKISPWIKQLSFKNNFFLYLKN
jgi:GT2 family glycosyltransferase